MLWISPLAALALTFAGCMPWGRCPPLGDVMRQYGYTELRPPSNLLQPGAIVYIIKRDPFVAGIICGPRASLGADWQPTVSATAPAELQRTQGHQVALGAPLMASIRADARFSSIKTITTTLNNPVLVEVDDVAVVEHQAARSEACRLAVHARLAQGYAVTMVSSGLRGDITYQVEWHQEANLGAQAKVAALGALAVELGGGATDWGAQHIAAQGLVWGIKDDAFLAALSVEVLDEQQVPRGTALLPVHEPAHLAPTPDAPLVAAPGTLNATPVVPVTLLNGGAALPKKD